MACGDSFCYNVTNEPTNGTAFPPEPPRPPPQIPTLQDLLGVHWEYNVAQALGIYVFPVIIGLGTMGNILSFLVLIRKTMRSSSTCFYMMIMSIADTMVLYFSALRKWFSLINGYDAITRTEIGCKLFNFLSYFSFDWSVWLLVAMTIERFIAIHFPLKAIQMATPSRARKVILLLLMLFILVNCHFFWTVTKDDKDQCIPHDDYVDFHDNVVPWLDAVIYSFLPFVILITFNILIIRDNWVATTARRTLRGRNQINQSHVDIRARFQHKLTITLISVSIMFLICSCPKVILIGIRETEFQFFSENGIPNFLKISEYLLVSRISDLFLYINHSFNFVLYSIHGQRFRSELKKLILCRSQNIRRTSTISLSMDAVCNRNTADSILTSVHNISTVSPNISIAHLDTVYTGELDNMDRLNITDELDIHVHEHSNSNNETITDIKQLSNITGITNTETNERDRSINTTCINNTEHQTSSERVNIDTNLQSNIMNRQFDTDKGENNMERTITTDTGKGDNNMERTITTDTGKGDNMERTITTDTGKGDNNMKRTITTDTGKGDNNMERTITTDTGKEENNVERTSTDTTKQNRSMNKTYIHTICLGNSFERKDTDINWQNNSMNIKYIEERENDNSVNNTNINTGGLDKV